MSDTTLAALFNSAPTAPSNTISTSSTSISTKQADTDTDVEMIDVDSEQLARNDIEDKHDGIVANGKDQANNKNDKSGGVKPDVDYKEGYLSDATTIPVQESVTAETNRKDNMSSRDAQTIETAYLLASLYTAR